MGNSNNSKTSDTSASMSRDFQMQKYINKGVQKQQILKIKQAFDSYHPQNGQIDVQKLKQSTQQSGSRTTIQRYLRGKQKLNFDQFFQMSKQLVQQQISKNPGLVIDTSEVQATCLFCPYTVDKPTN